MNINCNYDDNCKMIELEYCDNEVILKVIKNNTNIQYKENMIIDLNYIDEITLENISNGDKIIFLNGKDGTGTIVNIDNKAINLPANYTGMSIYNNKLVFL